MLAVALALTSGFEDDAMLSHNYPVWRIVYFSAAIEHDEHISRDPNQILFNV